MGALTDIQYNIEKLRSLQESLHDLCTFISTLDLTSGAKEDTLINGIAELKEAFANIDLSSLETTLVSGLNEVKNAVENIELPEIDTSAIAKQGENAEATNTAILAEIKAINDLKNIYSVRFEQNQDGDSTYTMVLPLVAGIVGDTIIM